MNLVITFDYELFGDGSGDVFEHMIEPTEAILGTCEQHGIKTTLFFEVIEYLRLKEEWDKGNTMSYTKNPIKAIEQQIQRTALSGHDIQLHFHPQWLKADFEGNQWQMDWTNWRLGDFSTKDCYTIKDLLKEGKEVLEAIVRKVKPEYQCIAIRAGAYNIMPSKEVYRVMKNLGLKLDSSVYPGGFENGRLSKYDYREVPQTKDFWWASSKDIRKESSENMEIMEIPIFALPQRRIHKLLNMGKVKSLFLQRDQAMSSVAKEKISNQSLLQKVQYLFGKEALTWDFCLFSNGLHQKFFSSIEKNYSQTRDTFVIIGHPKSYTSSRSLNSLILQAKKSDHNYTFKTLKEMYEEFSS